MRLQLVDGVQHVDVIGGTEHFQQEADGQFRLGEVERIVPLTDKREQAVVQVAGEFRLATEDGKSVERVIAYEPLVQVVPVRRQVHFGVFPGFFAHEGSYRRTV